VRFEGYDGPVSSERHGDSPVGAAALAGAFPNPFVETGTIRYEIGRSGPASLRIFDVTGRLIRELVNGPVVAGRRTISWDGRDALGAPVGPGVYFVRLESGGTVRTRKLVRAAE
jgi:hypothetical protein